MTENNKQPYFIANSVRENSQTGKAHWTEIGVAFPHEDGQGFNLVLNALPMERKIVLRRPKESEAQA
ncbi:MAG: hypothetical protein Q7P63_12275 [Verrucomicrobiota bacterium JB022]|nr:hypothetical protein [Verrucomicrobiota bacterium JB022]